MIDRTKIKAFRAAHGLPQTDIAAHLDISATQYSKKEAGKNEFTEREADILRDLMGCDYNFLFTVKVDNPSTRTENR